MARDIPFDEWRRQQLASLEKAPRSGGVISPISPREPTIGPTRRPGYPTEPSKYLDPNRTQPPPWINDVDSDTDFYSPMQPVWPFGPPNVNVPREWDYPIGSNLNFIPQRIEMFGLLRGLASSWGVLATIISTRQDQILRIPFTFKRKDKPSQPSVAVDEMKKFFKSPDGKLTYSQWTNKLLYDLLVIDAPTIYLFRNRRGRPMYAEVLDGATIFPLIDDTGRRPDSETVLTEDGLVYLKRQPAFQQIIKGMPLIDLDESEIMYMPMRPRPNMPLFGYPGTEQILIEATEAVRKTFYQSNFWAEGTIPDLIVTVPEAWTPRQIAAFQAHFDAMFSGNLTLKSKVRFLPSGMKPFDIKNANGESLWSQRDETLIRLACYAYSVSPTPFVKAVNRSTAQSAQQTAEDEGLYPLMSYWKDNIIDPIIQQKFGYEDVEFVFKPQSERDGEKLAKTHQVLVDDGIVSIDEARAERGLEPIPGGNVHTIKLGNAIVPVEAAARGAALPMQGGTDNGEKPRPGSNPRSSTIPAQNDPRRGARQPSGEAPAVGKVSSLDVDDAASDADGDVDNHSHAQLEAGNYKKGHLRLHGLDISIENSYGSKRGKRNPDGSLRWSANMPAHYGYIRRTEGADGDQVDVYIGRRPDLKTVWVIDQFKTTKKLNRRFDEHKVMLGYKSLRRALRDFRATRTDGFNAIESVTEMSVDELKTWLKDGDLSTACAGQCGKTVFQRSDVAKADTISSATGLSTSYLIRRKKTKRRSANSGPRWLELRA